MAILPISQTPGNCKLFPKIKKSRHSATELFYSGDAGWRSLCESRRAAGLLYPGRHLCLDPYKKPAHSQGRLDCCIRGGILASTHIKSRHTRKDRLDCYMQGRHFASTRKKVALGRRVANGAPGRDPPTSVGVLRREDSFRPEPSIPWGPREACRVGKIHRRFEL